MGKGKRQRLLRQNPRAPRHISPKPPRVSEKAVELQDAIARLDQVKVNAFGQLIWPGDGENQSTKESNDRDSAP